MTTFQQHRDATRDTRLHKQEAQHQPHVLLYNELRGEYAHLKALIALGDPDAYPRPNYITVKAQIGQHDADMIRHDLKQSNASDRAYARRLEYDSSQDGLNLARLKVLTTILRRFEKNDQRWTGTTGYMLAAFDAAKVHQVFLEPMEGRAGRPLEFFELLDIRKPADRARLAEWLNERVEALWEKTAPRSVVADVRRQLADEAAAAQETAEAAETRDEQPRQRAS